MIKHALEIAATVRPWLDLFGFCAFIITIVGLGLFFLGSRSHFKHHDD